VADTITLASLLSPCNSAISISLCIHAEA
jgi:hypothetical protein